MTDPISRQAFARLRADVFARLDAQDKTIAEFRTANAEHFGEVLQQLGRLQGAADASGAARQAGFTRMQLTLMLLGLIASTLFSTLSLIITLAR